MKNAHRIYNRSWSMTFSEALKEAWKRGKEAVEVLSAESKKAAKAEFYKQFDKRLAREYKNVSFGRNDWKVDRRTF